MTPGTVMEIGRQAIEVTLLISAPALLAALVVGLIISIFQATTQIQEQTLVFVPKIIATFEAILIFGPWILGMVVDFTRDLFMSFNSVIR